MSRHAAVRIAAIACSSITVLFLGAAAPSQEAKPAPPAKAAQPAPPAFSAAEIEQLVAPIALHPDDLLSQILIASSSRNVPSASEFAVYSAVSNDTATWLCAARL